MSSKIHMKRAFLGLLTLAAFGIAQNGQQDENNGIPAQAVGTDNTLQAAQRFRPPPRGFGSGRQSGGGRMTTSNRGGRSSRFSSNDQQFDPSQFDDSEYDDSEFDPSQLDDGQQSDDFQDEDYQQLNRPPPYGGNQRRPTSNQQTRPGRPQSNRFGIGGGGNRQQSPNQQGPWQGQPGTPIVFNPPGTRQICPFDDQKGPNILIAQVSVPSSPPTQEIDAWSFGDNWCSNANSISDTQDICSLQDGREFMHVPLTDKFGALDTQCYANFKVWFAGCSYNNDGSMNYDNVVAIMENTDTQDVILYECRQDSEHRGCLYNGQLPVPTQTDFEAFLICGIQAEP